MVYQAIDLIKFNANVKNLEIIVDIKNDVPCDIVVDDIRIKQILINLLSNAVKFTHEGQVELIISNQGSINNKTKLKFEVIDTGIGIKKENTYKILDAFSLGIPVISSSIGIEGIPAVNGVHFFQADNPVEYLNAINTLFNNPQRALELTINANRDIVPLFSIKHCGEIRYQCY